MSAATPALPAGPRICWLGGWAIAPQRTLAAAQSFFPEATHRAFTPTPEGLQALCDTVIGGEADFVFGYSMGAFLLLRQSAVCDLGVPLRLFAPFVDFRAESGLGSRVVLTRSKVLLRRLRASALEAVADFYQQSGLKSQPPEVLPYEAEGLIWGIEQLVQTAVPLPLEPARHASLRGWVGGQDALLDAAQISTLVPGCRVLEDSGHDLRDLLTAAMAAGGVL